jgi:hypothetical protein
VVTGLGTFPVVVARKGHPFFFSMRDILTQTSEDRIRTPYFLGDDERMASTGGRPMDERDGVASSKTEHVALEGYELINTPRLNKGTAFSDHERDIFHLHGLLPPHIGNLEDQIERRLQALATQPTPFNQYSFLRDLQDTNETLFYALSCTRRPSAKAASALAKSGESHVACF